MNGLVLTRKVGQKVLVGGDIVITIVRVKGSRVRVGVKAPRAVRVLREELRPKAPNTKRKMPVAA